MDGLTYGWTGPNFRKALLFKNITSKEKIKDSSIRFFEYKNILGKIREEQRLTHKQNNKSSAVVVMYVNYKITGCS